MRRAIALCSVGSLTRIWRETIVHTVVSRERESTYGSDVEVADNGEVGAGDGGGGGHQSSQTHEYLHSETRTTIISPCLMYF